MAGLTLTVLRAEYAVWQLPPSAGLPSIPAGDFLSLTRTPSELSGVCAVAQAPSHAKVETGWRCIRVNGPLEFHLTGILASLATQLADAEISIFALSTYDTDYLLVRAGRLPEAIAVLERAGHDVATESSG